MTRGGVGAPLSRPGSVLIGAAFVLAGGWIVAISLGLAPVDPATVHAPMWVVGSLGGAFALVGVWLAAGGTRVGQLIGPAVGPLVMVVLLAVLHWVAFGAGERRCTGGISLPFVSAWWPTGPMQCRLAFGYGAVLFDGVLLFAGLRHLADTRLQGIAARLTGGAANAVLLVALAPLLLLLIPLLVVKAGWNLLRGTRSA